MAVAVAKDPKKVAAVRVFKPGFRHVQPFPSMDRWWMSLSRCNVFVILVVGGSYPKKVPFAIRYCYDHEPSVYGQALYLARCSHESRTFLKERLLLRRTSLFKN
ncbi:hypothetical protein CTI12_AA315710 [Artemisia annua]|uniref:Uncharacterized protein n=1 Tax=Artemisia annua TaxID=35608 RepID=A0A2U1N2R7_ARTAN|nr:hypothetical protein CTI12_AA315710 [Artemisia annua]